jgi:hypothetical protein
MGRSAAVGGLRPHGLLVPALRVHAAARRGLAGRPGPVPPVGPRPHPPRSGPARGPAARPDRRGAGGERRRRRRRARALAAAGRGRGPQDPRRRPAPGAARLPHRADQRSPRRPHDPEGPDGGGGGGRQFAAGGPRGGDRGPDRRPRRSPRAPRRAAGGAAGAPRGVVLHREPRVLLRGRRVDRALRRPPGHDGAQRRARGDRARRGPDRRRRRHRPDGAGHAPRAPQLAHDGLRRRPGGRPARRAGTASTSSSAGTPTAGSTSPSPG